MTGDDVEEAILEMYLSGISVRKIAGVTDALSKVKVGKDPSAESPLASKANKGTGGSARTFVSKSSLTESLRDTNFRVQDAQKVGE